MEIVTNQVKVLMGRKNTSARNELGSGRENELLCSKLREMFPLSLWLLPALWRFRRRRRGGQKVTTGCFRCHGGSVLGSHGCFFAFLKLHPNKKQTEKNGIKLKKTAVEDDDAVVRLDAQLIKACGGRTAHKGVRHGLTISAKLARLEQQEAEFMAKYGKKSQSGSLQTPPTKEEEETQQRKKKMMKQRIADGEEEVTENGVQPKKKEEEEVEAGRGEGDEKKRKTKRKRNESHSIESEALPPGTEDEKKKKKQPQVEAAEEKEEIRDVSVKQKKKQKKDKIRGSSSKEEENKRLETNSHVHDF
ncbi:G patch domain-containing protein 4-like [Gouania willdenowi]|uniref:G patch domain-containing protein 4-like n=1 Tax=Gouania willdenowi TaxID=441366 RepID=UPI001056C91B|nr:G patch domain-containing protein 4-like [Gouania willdenowi]